MTKINVNIETLIAAVWYICHNETPISSHWGIDGYETPLEVTTKSATIRFYDFEDFTVYNDDDGIFDDMNDDEIKANATGNEMITAYRRIEVDTRVVTITLYEEYRAYSNPLGFENDIDDFDIEFGINE